MHYISLRFLLFHGQILPSEVSLHRLIASKGSTIWSWCKDPIHHSFRLFPRLKASSFFLVIIHSNALLLVISSANNASFFPPPLCHGAEHHQSHPESLQKNIFWSSPSATSGLVKPPRSPTRNLTTYTPTPSFIDSTCIPRNWTRPIPNKFATFAGSVMNLSEETICETQLLTDQKLSSSIFPCCSSVRPDR